jgi:hypothetical protein
MVVPTFLYLFVGCAHAADLFVVMEFRVIALPAQGIEPETGDGLVKIVLAESCGDVLAKLEGIKRWRVQPTMLRGARKVAAHGDETGLSGMGQKKKRLRLRTKKRAKKELIPKGKKKTHNVPEVKGADEVTDNEIRRTPEGRAMIKLLLQSGCARDHIYENGATALMTACEKQTDEVANTLLQAGASVNKSDSDAWRFPPIPF